MAKSRHTAWYNCTELLLGLDLSLCFWLHGPPVGLGTSNQTSLFDDYCDTWNEVVCVEMTTTRTLQRADFSQGGLEGELSSLPVTPTSHQLSVLYMQGNKLRGQPAGFLQSLDCLNTIDLSDNLLGGDIHLAITASRADFMYLGGIGNRWSCPLPDPQLYPQSASGVQIRSRWQDSADTHCYANITLIQVP